MRMTEFFEMHTDVLVSRHLKGFGKQRDKRQFSVAIGFCQFFNGLLSRESVRRYSFNVSFWELVLRSCTSCRCRTSSALSAWVIKQIHSALMEQIKFIIKSSLQSVLYCTEQMILLWVNKHMEFFCKTTSVGNVRAHSILST